MLTLCFLFRGMDVVLSDYVKPDSLMNASKALNWVVGCGTVSVFSRQIILGIPLVTVVILRRLLGSCTSTSMTWAFAKAWLSSGRCKRLQVNIPPTRLRPSPRDPHYTPR